MRMLLPARVWLEILGDEAFYECEGLLERGYGQLIGEGFLEPFAQRSHLVEESTQSASALFVLVPIDIERRFQAGTAEQLEFGVRAHALRAHAESMCGAVDDDGQRMAQKVEGVFDAARSP
jgi:hypothetical protein